MELWLETSDLQVVKNASQMGILHGVATNPTIGAKSNLSFDDLLQALLDCQTGPVVAQVMGKSAQEIIQQGEALFAFSNRIIVNIPVTREGLQGINILSMKKIPVLASGVFDIKQALLAARSKAIYISPHFSQICEADQDGINNLKAMAELMLQYQYPAKIIASSLKSTEQIKECCNLGIDAVALNETVFEEYVSDHPATMKMIDRFSRDWKKACPRKNLPF